MTAPNTPDIAEVEAIARRLSRALDRAEVFYPLSAQRAAIFIRGWTLLNDRDGEGLDLSELRILSDYLKGQGS